VVVDIEGEKGLLSLTSNINNNPLSHPISTATHSHLQYQQQPTHFLYQQQPFSPPISTSTHSHLQYQQQPTQGVVVDIGGERGLLLIL
jgi:hypothetical protein